MSTTTITFELRLAGVLTDVTNVFLSDPTAAYGVRRTDTLAVVVNDGTAMTRQSTGVYAYTLTDPAPGLTYDYWVEFVYQGATYRFPRTQAGTSSTTTGSTSLVLSAIVGEYISAQDMADIYGRANILKWSNKDGNATDAMMAAALLDAIRDGEMFIDNYFRDSRYATPLAPVDTTITCWNVHLATAKLYRMRGLMDAGDDVAGHLEVGERQAKLEMGRYKSMLLTANWATRFPQPTAPIAGDAGQVLYRA